MHIVRTRLEMLAFCTRGWNRCWSDYLLRRLKIIVRLLADDDRALRVEMPFAILMIVVSGCDDNHIRMLDARDLVTWHITMEDRIAAVVVIAK